MALNAARNKIDHHQSALRHGELQIGRFADEGGVEAPGAVDGVGHGGVAGFFAVGKDAEETTLGGLPGRGNVGKSERASR